MKQLIDYVKLYLKEEFKWQYGLFILAFGLLLLYLNFYFPATNRIHYYERNWERLGPKLAGKVRIYCGLEDTFGLERAVILLQKEMEKLDHDFEFVLVPGRDHGSIAQPHDEHWPGGMMDRIHREMAARYASTR